MLNCKKCNSELKKDQRFCSNCGYDNYSKEPKKTYIRNIIIVVVFILAVVSLISFTLKGRILQSYYTRKGDSEKSSIAITYYTKALNMKYSNDIVQKIGAKLEESDNPEKELDKLKGTLDKKDLNELYVDVYIQKAKDNFVKDNYKTTRKYLNMAQNYNYDIETFEYYEDLVAFEEKEDKNKQEEKLANAKDQTQEKETVYLVENNHYDYNYDNSYGNDYSYFIIPDSHTRYLTKQELSGYNKSQLGYIRNEIFARYGYIFKNKVYSQYFNSKPWYLPDSTFSGSIGDLNAIEKYNVELIKSLE